MTLLIPILLTTTTEHLRRFGNKSRQVQRKYKNESSIHFCEDETRHYKNKYKTKAHFYFVRLDFQVMDEQKTCRYEQEL